MKKLLYATVLSSLLLGTAYADVTDDNYYELNEINSYSVITSEINNYTFMTPKVPVTTGNAVATLEEAIKDSSVSEYTLSDNYTVSADLGTLAGTGRNFTINGQGYSLSGNNQYKGITLTSGQTLSINNTTVSDFSANTAACIANTSGTLNITDSLFNNNSSTSSSAFAIINSIGGHTNIEAKDRNVEFNSNSAYWGSVLRLFNNSTLSTAEANDKYIIFDGNTSSNLGGVAYINNSSVDIKQKVKFTNNTSKSNGGAIFAYESNVIIGDNAEFSNNTTNTGKGGALYIVSNSDVTIGDNAQFTNNKSTTGSGGAVYILSSDVEIGDNAQFTNNTADSNGGAIILVGGDLTIGNNTTFESNSADYGGAVFLQDKTTDTYFYNTKFLNNSATSYGSAIYNIKSSEDTIGSLRFIADNNAEEQDAVVISSTGSRPGIYSQADVYFDAFSNKNIVVNDIVTTKDKIVYINKNGGDGTIKLNNVINTTSGEGDIELHSGTLSLSGDGANQTFSTFAAKGGTINLQNDNAGDNVVILNLSGNGSNLAVDFDASNGYMDNLSVMAVTGTPKITLNSINVTADGSATTAVYLKGAARNQVEVITEAITAVTPNYTYIFTPIAGTNGALSVEGGAISTTLPEAIANSSVNAYSIVSENYQVNETLGNLAGANRNFTIYGNGYDIDGQAHGGISVGEGKTLNINGTKSDSEGITTFKNFALTPDADTSLIYNEGSVNINNTNFSNNTANTQNGYNIVNAGTMNITANKDISFSNNTNVNGATAIYNLIGTTTVNANNGSVTFSNNQATDTLSLGAIGSYGGAIILNANNNNISFESNSASFGSAITLLDTATLTTNENAENKISFSQNNAIFYGGALYIEDAASANLQTKTDFTGNTSSIGGAIYNDGTVTIANNANFENNTAQHNAYSVSQSIVPAGGAILNNGTSLQIGNNAAFYGNKAISSDESISSVGGAITNYGGTVTIGNDAKFGDTNKGNEADFGGAIYNTGTSLQIGNNADFKENYALVGGAVYSSSPITIGKNANFSDNAAYYGGALYLEDVTTDTTLTNTKFLNNYADEGAAIFHTKTNENVVLGSLKFVADSASAEKNAVVISSANGSGSGIYSESDIYFDASADKNIVVNDVIKIADDKKIYINQNNGTGTIELNNKINNLSAQNGKANIELNSGYLYLSGEGANQTFATFAAKGGTINLQNENAGDNIVISNLSGNGSNLQTDFDASNGKMDKLTVNTVTGTPSITLNSINITADGDTELAIYIDGAGKDSLTLIDEEISAATSTGYTYVFTPVANNKGALSVFKKLTSGSLVDSIADETIKSYSIVSQDYSAEATLGNLAGANRNFIIYGNGYDIDGLSHGGVSVGEGQILTINGAKEEYAKITALKNFAKTQDANASVIYNTGTVNINDVNFSANTALTENGYNIFNAGEMNITANKNIVFANNQVINNGGVINNTGTVNINGNAQFTGNSAGQGGAIYNDQGIVNINANNGDVVFSNNTASLGGAIYNTATVNFDAAGNNKIVFEKNSDSIYNTGTLNFKSGNIQINSSVQDSETKSGTTNISGANVLLSDSSQINQKTLNINAGSLTANASGLKTETIKNNATLNLTGGTLNSPVSADTYSDYNIINVKNDAVTLATDLSNQNIYVTSELIANSQDYTNQTNNLILEQSGVLNMQDDDKTINSIVLKNFTIKDSNTAGIKFDTDFNSTLKTNDVINIIESASGLVNLKSINVKSNFNGLTKTITLFSGGDLSNLSINSTKTTYGNVTYNFEQGKNAGEIYVTKEKGYTLSDAITKDGANLNIDTFSLENNLLMDSDIGTLERNDKNEPREFTINGNNFGIDGQNQYSGITVNTGDTLHLKDINNFRNFSTAVTNSGTTTLDNVIFENNNADIINNGSIIFEGKQSELSGDLTGNGNVQISTVLDLGKNKIKQSGIEITPKGTLTAAADNVQISNSLSNNGKYILTSGINNNNVTGSGTVFIDGDISNNAVINNSVTVNQEKSLISNANDLRGNIVNNGTLNFNGGTISQDITGQGVINLDGQLIINNDVSAYTGNVTLKQNSTLLLQNGTLFTGAKTFTAENNSEINLLNSKKNDVVFENLAIAGNDEVKLSIDWKDTINSKNKDNVLGKINVTKINLEKLYADDSYLFSNLGDKIVVDMDKITLQTSNYKPNFIGYDANSGMLSAKTATSLYDAIEYTSTGENLYILKKSESADNAVLTKGNLVIDGKGNAITNQGLTVGDGNVSNVTLTLKDTNVRNVNISGNQGAITVVGNNYLLVNAENKDIKFTGINNPSGYNNAILLIKDGNNPASVTLNAQNKSISIDNDVRSNSVDNTLNLLGRKIVLSGTLDPLTANVSANVIRTGNNVYDESITYNLNSGGYLQYTNDLILYNPGYHDVNSYYNTMNFNGGSLDLRNNAASAIVLNGLGVNANSNMYVDVDLRNGYAQMDKLVSLTPVTVAGGQKLSIVDMNIMDDVLSQSSTINFTNDNNLKSAVDFTDREIAGSIYKYNVGYSQASGDFNFSKKLGTGYSSFTPSVFVAPVAAQLGGFLSQVNSYEQAFSNMDLYTPSRKAKNQDLEDEPPLPYITEEKRSTNESRRVSVDSNGIWFRPYGVFEKVKLENGPEAGNNLYGIFVGGNSSAIPVGKDSDIVVSGYAGYNGSHQTFDGNGIYQNGGQIGATAVYYKNKFFTGLTANVGFNFADASTNFGKENFNLLTTGVASKTGYNWDVANGRLIIQPNFLMSYSFVHTFSYDNASGVNIKADPLHAIQIAPGLKIAGNFKNSWQPYISANMVWNIMDKTKFRGNSIELPETSINPYVQYGIGLQKKVGSVFTANGQAMFRSGARNGVSLGLGMKWAIGKKVR